MPSKTTLPLDVKQALKQAALIFQKKKLTSSWLDAEVLLAYVLKKDRSFIVSHGEKQLTPSQIKQFHSLVRLRAQHYPVAYLLGKKEFYGLEFLVTKDTLVPRPDSELIIDEAKKLITTADTLIIDIGTGSGCLIISLLNKLKKNNYKLSGIALDISKKALEVAKKNAQKHHIQNITFLKSNLLSIIIKNPLLLKRAPQIIIMANLPYLTNNEIKKENSISREPRLALDGGHQGLYLYQQLAAQIYKIKISNQNLQSISILCEINPHQQKNFAKIWKSKPKFVKDYSGHIRVGIVTI